MGLNKETTCNRGVETAETDEQFIVRLDDRLKTAFVPRARATVQHIIEGNHDDYHRALETYIDATTIDEVTSERLRSLRQTDGLFARLSRLLNLRFTSADDDLPISHEMNDVLNQWRKVRSDLHYSEIKGVDSLTHFWWINFDDRDGIFEALHKKDEELGKLVLKHIQLGKESAVYSGKPYTQELLGAHDDNIEIDEIPVTIERITDLLKPLRRLSAIERSAKLENQFLVNPIDVPGKIAFFIGHEILYKKLTIIVPSTRTNYDCCIPICPPEEIAVILYELDTDHTYQLSIPVHEIGHGIHIAGIQPNLAFVERITGSIWHESMAFLYEDLMLEPDILIASKNREDLDRFRVCHMGQRYRSLCVTLKNLSLDQLLHNEKEISEDGLIEQLAAMHKEHNPSWEHNNPYWWATNEYVVADPFCGVSHLYGWMNAAQIRAWWKRTHDEPLLSKAFGDFLREKCYAPGNSVPWRQLLKEITGEDVNPQYLVDELSFAFKKPDEQ